MKDSILGSARKLMAVSLAGALALGSIGTALAQSPGEDGDKKYGIFGTVVDKGNSQLTVRTRQGEELELAISADTSFRVPGETEADLDSVQEGSRVAVLAQGDADARTALKVMVVPGEPQRHHRVLTVVDISGNTVIAQDAQGNQVEVELDHEVSQDIQGQLVTFIGVASQKSNRFKANAEVKIAQVVERLEAHALKLAERAEAEASAEAKLRLRDNLAQLKARLEASMQKHLDVFTRVIASAPEQSQASLKGALELTLQGYQQALDVLAGAEGSAEARLKLRPAHGTVESVDAAAGGLTIKTDSGATLSLKVDSETEVRLNGQEATLADLEAGTVVSVRYNSETMVAAEVIARARTEARASGVIASVDSASGQVTVELDNGRTIGLRVDTATEIEINGQPATLADLEAGASVKVRYDASTGVALQIEARAEAEAEEDTEDDATARGTVKSVNTLAGQIVIEAEDGTEITLNITSDTETSIDGQAATLAALAAIIGASAEVEYSTETSNALSIEVTGNASSSLGLP